MMLNKKITVKLSVQDYARLIAFNHGKNLAIQLEPLVEIYASERSIGNKFGLAIRRDLTDGFIFATSDYAKDESTKVVRNLPIDFEFLDEEEFIDVFKQKEKFGGVYDRTYNAI